MKRIIVLLAILTLVALAAAYEEETYDPDEGDGEPVEDYTPADTNKHVEGAMSGGLHLGALAWPRTDEYGYDASGFDVGLRFNYYFLDNLGGVANLDFAFGEYTTLVRILLGAEYNIPISTQFTAFINAGIAIELGSWTAYSYADRDLIDDPENESHRIYSEGGNSNVGANITGGIEFFINDQISLRPAVGFDFAGSLHTIYGLGVSYYL